jgi:hypothetical protein
MSTLAESPYLRPYREHCLISPEVDRSPWTPRGFPIVVISAVTEVGIVRAIAYGWGRGLSHYRPIVEEMLKIVGTPGVATIGQPVEWTGGIYLIPHYLTRYVKPKAIPRGIFLFRRLEGDSHHHKWSFEFEDEGEFLAPLPKGW